LGSRHEKSATTKCFMARCSLLDACFPRRPIPDANKREIRRRFIEIAEALEAAQPKQLADGLLLLLVEGAYAISQTMSGSKGPGHAIVWAAEALVDAQCGGARRRS
jgi:hypothetical protein